MKAPSPFGEVLSSEFWVLSCLVCGHARRGGWARRRKLFWVVSSGFWVIYPVPGPKKPEEPKRPERQEKRAGLARGGGWLGWSIWFVWSIWFIWFTDRTNEINQTNQRNEM